MSVLTSASPFDESFAAGSFFGWGAVRPRCKPSPVPTILLYMTSRFAYMKQLLCCQLILIFLYLCSAWMLFFRALQSFSGYLRLTLVFVWSNVLREKFNFILWSLDTFMIFSNFLWSTGLSCSAAREVTR